MNQDQRGANSFIILGRAILRPVLWRIIVKCVGDCLLSVNFNLGQLVEPYSVLFRENLICARQ